MHTGEMEWPKGKINFHGTKRERDLELLIQFIIRRYHRDLKTRIPLAGNEGPHLK